MDPEKYKNKRGKVAGTTRVKPLEIKYKNPNYEVKLLPNTPATETGLVEVMELVPKVSNLPKFVARWDENKHTLDVDLYEGEKINKNPSWKSEENGHKGHHPIRRTGAPRIFDIDVRIPNAKIFEGSLNVSLLFKESVELKIHSEFLLEGIFVKKMMDSSGDSPRRKF